MIGTMCSDAHIVQICSGEKRSELSIYWLIYFPAHTYGHELWVVTEIIRLWMQAAQSSKNVWGKRLFLLACLGTPQYPLRRDREGDGGEGVLGSFALMQP